MSGSEKWDVGSARWEIIKDQAQATIDGLRDFSARVSVNQRENFVTIQVDDLRGPAVVELLRSHLRQLSELSPPESMHALDLNGLRRPEVTFWSVWEEEELMGCGALKELDARHAELKSMRTAAAHLRKGVASRLVEHIIAEAKQRGYRRLSLETGTGKAFEPAQRLYAKFGFRPCGPFGEYVEDPNSVFMTRDV